MVSTLPLCVTVGMTLCPPDTMSEDITQQKHYSELEQSEVEVMVNEIFKPTTYTRSIADLETIEYIEGYYDYVEEQERLEQERIAEEQRRIEEEQRRLEEERKYQEWLDSFNRKGYRQTVYAVTEGEVQLGSGYYYGHSSVKNINNVMHYNDSQYGWLPIVAINMDEVISSGQNNQGIWNTYGSVIEMKQGDKIQKAIVLDACGACRYANKIDLWIYDTDWSLDTTGIDWRYIRNGWN